MSPEPRAPSNSLRRLCRRVFPFALCPLPSALLALGLVAAPAFAQGKCRPAGALKAGRSGHTATLLKDGRVLVVGGRGSDATTELTTVELFDPKKSKWSPGPPLSVGRAGHTATLLSDGRVLVAGGTGSDPSGGGHRYVALATAELYDPKANAWKAAAPMKDARNWHTATLLSDGRVLVTGGAREMRQHLASCELYSPQDDGWKPAGTLKEARCMHLAVPTAGGVLVLGGRNNAMDKDTGYGRPIATTERFDAAALAWTPGPDMADARQFHAAVTVDKGLTLVVGGAAPTMLTNLAEWLAPDAAAWKLAENSLSQGRAHHTATAMPSGDVLVVGGETGDAVDTSLVQRLDVVKERWCVAGELKASRKKHTATLLPSGKVLVVGGTSAGIPEDTAELCEVTAGACVDPPGPALGF